MKKELTPSHWLRKFLRISRFGAIWALGRMGNSNLAEIYLLAALFLCPGIVLLPLTFSIKGLRPSAAHRVRYWTGIAFYVVSIVIPAAVFYGLHLAAKGGSDISGIHFLLAVPIGWAFATLGAVFSFTSRAERAG